MHFIMEHCRKMCGRKYGCDECHAYYCKPRFDLADRVKCSEHLLWMLVNGHNTVTHPNIADRIADECRATPEQRDSLVAAKHHGTYVPKPPKPTAAEEIREEISIQKNNNRPVVAVDVLGDELARYESADEAANYLYCSNRSIWRRCQRRCVKNEFEPFGITFRYADEFDAMTPEQRRSDVARY